MLLHIDFASCSVKRKYTIIEIGGERESVRNLVNENDMMTISFVFFRSKCMRYMFVLPNLFLFCFIDDTSMNGVAISLHFVVDFEQMENS